MRLQHWGTGEHERSGEVELPSPKARSCQSYQWTYGRAPSPLRVAGYQSIEYVHCTGYGLRGRQARARGSLLRDGVLLWVDPRESHRRRSLAHGGPLWLRNGRTLHQMLKEDEFTRRLADCEEIETLAVVDTLARGARKDPRLRTRRGVCSRSTRSHCSSETGLEETQLLFSSVRCLRFVGPRVQHQPYDAGTYFTYPIPGESWPGEASPSTAARPCMRPCIPPHYPFLTALLSLCDGLRQAEDALCRHLDRNITLVESVPSAHCSDY